MWIGGRSFSLAAPVLLALLLPAPAAPAADSPVNMAQPAVFGEATVGELLVGFPGMWSSDASLELDYQWRRCPAIGPCTDVPGASSLLYWVGPDDAGQRILLRVIASSGDATAVRDSEPTDPVPGASPPPVAPSATASPAVQAAPAPVVPRPRLLAPFPQVRIRGRFTMDWTEFTLVTVRAPTGAAIAIECAGPGCPFRDRRRTVRGRTLVRFPGLERRFRPGVTILVRVTKPGRIGKATRIWIRSGRRPGRWDGCVMPGSREPVACPPA